jgi:hypothetical protein
MIGFWKDRANRRSVIDQLGATLGIKNLDDWYPIIPANIAVGSQAITYLVNHHYGGDLPAGTLTLFAP